MKKLAREDHNMVGKNEVPLFIVDEQEKQQKQETEAEEKKKITAVQSIFTGVQLLFFIFFHIFVQCS